MNHKEALDSLRVKFENDAFCHNDGIVFIAIKEYEAITAYINELESVIKARTSDGRPRDSLGYLIENNEEHY